MSKLNVVLVIGLLIQAAVIAAMFARGDGPAIAKPTRVFADFDADKVTRIEVAGKKDAASKDKQESVTLEKTGATWGVSAADGYPADEEKVKEFLGKVEDLAHKELAAYLANAERLVAAGNLEELTRDDPPILMLSLNKDAQTGKLYCVLPGGICYPMPKLVPTVRSLLKGYLEKADEVGGAVAFTRAVPGAYEIHAVQSTEALALLVKTTGNRVYEQFLSSQEGMQKARQLLVTPRDGRTDPEEALVWNTFWEFFTRGLMGRRRRW